MFLFRNWTAAAAAGCAVLLPCAAAHADGLARFEQSIKSHLPPGALTYKNATALGDNGFVLENVVITPPAEATQGNKAAPIEIRRISVEDLDFDSIDKQTVPNFARIRAEGIAVGPKPVEGVDLMQLTGIEHLTADFQLDYRLEPERQTLTLGRLEIDLNGLGRLEVGGILDGVNRDDLGKPDAAMDKTSLRTATIVYEDTALMGKVIPAVAALQSLQPDDMVRSWTTIITGIGAGQGPATQSVLNAVSGFLTDYRQPKGPLRVTINPPNKTSAASIAKSSSPDDVVTALGLTVSYAAGSAPAPGSATAPSAPASSAPAPSAPATEAKQVDAGPTCTAGNRVFVFNDDSWSSATVRDVTKSGKECVVKLDGTSSDDVAVSTEKMIAWSIDGPGKPVAECHQGDKVIVESDGDWYPARVKADSSAAGKCVVKLDQADKDDDDQTVEMKRVRRMD